MAEYRGKHTNSLCHVPDRTETTVPFPQNPQTMPPSAPVNKPYLVGSCVRFLVLGLAVLWEKQEEVVYKVLERIAVSFPPILCGCYLGVRESAGIPLPPSSWPKVREVRRKVSPLATLRRDPTFTHPRCFGSQRSAGSTASRFPCKLNCFIAAL